MKAWKQRAIKFYASVEKKSYAVQSESDQSDAKRKNTTIINYRETKTLCVEY